MSDNIRIGITHGDFNGIGYEVIIKALSDSRMFEGRTIIVYGSSKAAAYHRKALDLEGFNFNLIKNAKEAHPKKANIINVVNNDIRVELGMKTPAGGQAAYDALKAAVADLKDNLIDAVVTAPINKENISGEGFNFPGHTEYFASEFGNSEPLMLLVCEKLKVGVVTGHIPVSKVASAISTQLIEKKLEIFNNSLIKDFGIRKPRIAVLGLNPHAGDGGLLGKEESEIISPAIENSKKKNIYAFGPFPADGFMGNAEYFKYDGVLGMYHDQVLIPFKVIAFEDGVNFTAGLSIVRTSPDHGTGFDIAGKNIASEESLRQAVYYAEDIFNNRKKLENLKQNQLKPQKLEE